MQWLLVAVILILLAIAFYHLFARRTDHANGFYTWVVSNLEDISFIFAACLLISFVLVAMHEHHQAGQAIERMQ